MIPRFPERLNLPFLSKLKGNWEYSLSPLDVSPSPRRWGKGTQRGRVLRMCFSLTARPTLPSAELIVIDPWPHRKFFPGCQESCNHQKTNSWKKHKAIKLSARRKNHLKFKFRRLNSIKPWQTLRESSFFSVYLAVKTYDLFFLCFDISCYGLVQYCLKSRSSFVFFAFLHIWVWQVPTPKMSLSFLQFLRVSFSLFTSFWPQLDA